MPAVSADTLLERLRGRFEELCRGIADAVNQAPTGPISNARAAKVRDLFADFRRQAYPTAWQLKVDAAGAAFSPAEGPRRPPPAEPGP